MFKVANIGLSNLLQINMGTMIIYYRVFYEGEEGRISKAVKVDYKEEGGLP